VRDEVEEREHSSMNFADTKRLTNEGAKEMMATALASAKKQGIAVSIAIVDAGGHLILLAHGGRPLPHRAFFHH
jgi:uncharacterized protein GlcG (DUF336 family)